MSRFELCLRGLAALLLLVALPAGAQSFRVQCPTSTITHPSNLTNTSAEPTYNGATAFTTNAQGFVTPSTNVNGAIKCQQISGGDGYSTMADGTQTFMFSFGPLSGLADIAAGWTDGHYGANAGTEFPSVFNTVYPFTPMPGDPATTDGASGGGAYAPGNGGAGNTGGTPSFTYNGAIGLAPDADCIAGNAAAAAAVPPAPLPCPNLPSNGLSGHVDPRQIMDVGVMNGNIPAPLMAFDEDDEFFLTLTNVGMIMRPDLFEQHTVHFHGYPNASSFYDGVPDASVAINIGGSFTYYYLAPDAGTYFWHCHITPPEHLQMGMVGQLYVRPRQDRVPPVNGTATAANDLYVALAKQNGVNAGFTACTPAPCVEPNPGPAPSTQTVDLRTACNPSVDILCSATMPAVYTAAAQKLYPAKAGANGAPHPNAGRPYMYVYNDGDGSTQYDVEYPIQMHGFDPNFHFVGMTFNPEAFVDMKSKYFLLNGRSYPDTVSAGPQQTESSDGKVHYSQPMNTIINIPQGGKAALRLVNLAVDEYHTLASLGIRMNVIGWNAKLLRDQEGHNLNYYTNSITLGGGESLDVILDTCQNRAVFDSCTGTNAAGLPATPIPTGTYYLYTPTLDHLSNDAENFGGMLTEVHVN
jgi:multicopper oxidase